MEGEKILKKSDFLGTEKIGKLLFQLSFPAVIAMTIQALYNLVDAIFVGRGVGSIGIAGISVAFPIQIFRMGVAQTIGMGGASVISRSLGSDNREKANKALGNIISLVVISSILITVLGMLFLDPLMMIFGANEEILPYATDYGRIIILGTIIMSWTMAMNNIIRSEGKAKISMIVMLIGAISNIILDPIFIFSLNMGIAGAAYATILAQLFGGIFIMFYLFKGKSDLKLKIKNLLLNLKIVIEIVSIGVSSFVRQVSGSLLMIVLNNLLKKYGGTEGITIYGMINRLIMFALMPLFGLAQGQQPIVGYNYGARQYERVILTMKKTILIGTIMCIVGAVIMAIFPKPLLELFSSDPNLINEGIIALRIFIICFVLIGFQVVGTTMFLSIGKAVEALILAMSRQLIVLIPVVLLTSSIFGMFGIWIAFPISDGAAFLITLILYRRQMKKFKSILRI